VTIVRIVFTLRSRPGATPDGSGVTDPRLSQHLIVLADDAGHRAVPLWLRVFGAKQLLVLLGWPAQDDAMAHLLQTAALLLETGGVRVAAVDIEPVGEDVPELRSDTVTARVGLATAAGTRHVVVNAEYGLALATVAGVPVRVTDEVMDRLAVPVQGEDVLAPFSSPAADRAPKRPGQRWRFEPRNMAFTDGLDHWELAGSFPDAGQPHGQDYSCSAADRSAVLISAVPEPSGFAVLVQTIYADDYRGRTLTFRGELRAFDLAGHAG
jgi:bifunctional DNase/RNase